MVAGMAMAAAKLNPMVRLISTPGVYIGIHFILNVIFGSLNAGGVLKNEGPNAGNLAHSIISLVVMCLLLFFPLIYGGIKVVKDNTILFVLLLVHIVVNIAYFVSLLFIPEEEAKKIIAIIYSVASFLVCVGIAIVGDPKNLGKIKQLFKNKLQKKTEAPTEKSSEVPEAAAPPAAPAAQTAENSDPAGPGNSAKKDFGKRQRRRNPPKRRKKKY